MADAGTQAPGIEAAVTFDEVLKSAQANAERAAKGLAGEELEGGLEYMDEDGYEFSQMSELPGGSTVELDVLDALVVPSGTDSGGSLRRLTRSATGTTLEVDADTSPASKGSLKAAKAVKKPTTKVVKSGRPGRKATAKGQMIAGAEAEGVGKDADTSAQDGEQDTETGSQELAPAKRSPGRVKHTCPTQSLLEEVVSLTKTCGELKEKGEALEHYNQRLLEALKTAKGERVALQERLSALENHRGSVTSLLVTTNGSVAKALDRVDGLQKDVKESRYLQGFMAETQARLGRMEDLSQQHQHQYEQLGKRQRIDNDFAQLRSAAPTPSHGPFSAPSSDSYNSVNGYQGGPHRAPAVAAPAHFPHHGDRNICRR
ncbi:hypothetical protein FA13DRAFT_1797519 [Coprinellus micaceus]|uniref:Uncharacterized protein n=1 Tax=Coprinellus micaceus TaxID=71717 RepID=A0A4Y7SRA2_COPMI|nr:hypothetical protein FA13DRAFT_1797519 [Coprinellus micaceus]